MSLIIFSLGVMIFLSIFAVIGGGDWMNFDIAVLPDDMTTAFELIEGRDPFSTGSTLVVGDLAGAIAIIVIIITLGALIGIQVFGSGLSGNSVRMIILAVVYISLWTTLSLFAGDMLFSIEGFGSVIYVGLTLIYTVGVIRHIGGGNVGD